MRGWLLPLVLVACSKQSSNPDCTLVETEPATAMAKLSEKYPEAPGKVAETIERCIAPSGTTCERMAKIWKAIPSMMPGGGVDVSGVTDAVGVCNGMPPEMQRCLMPSYVVAHNEECTKNLADMKAATIESIDIKPAVGRPPQPTCDELRIELGTDTFRYHRGQKNGGLVAPGGQRPIDDAKMLEATLQKLASDCIGDATLTPADDVIYQDVIMVMDVAHKVGFMNIGLDAGEPDPDPAATTPSDHGTPGKDQLQNAPVIVITTTEIVINGKTVAQVDTDATAANAIASALSADPKPRSELVILQADQGTPSRTIKQAIIGARRAGYDNVLFAVKNK